MSNFFGQIKNFFGRQTENFKTLLITQIMNSAVRELVTGRGEGGGGGGAAGGASYLQLYLGALGANSQQIGYLNSAGKIASAAFGLPLGWISDRFSLKKVIITGLILSVIAATAFALSTSWAQAIPAMMVNTIATTLVGMFMNIFFVTSTKETADRATAMSMKNTLIALVGLAIPTISAIIVLNFGGLTVEGMRPLFIIEALGGTFVLAYAALKLKEVGFLQKKDGEQERKSILQDYKEIASIRSVQKWTFCKGLRNFFSGGLTPFYSIFYVSAKGATPVTIAAMGTVTTLGILMFLVPFGRLGDKYGRKRILYLTRPFHYISLLMVVFAPSPDFLILASFVGSLNSVSSLMEITMEHELVPGEQRGRWGGFLTFMMALAGIPGPILIGYLWGIIDPAQLLLLPILVDLPFLVILPTITDTLHVVYTQKSSQ